MLRNRFTAIAAAVLLMVHGGYGAESKDPQSQLIAAAGEAKQLKSADPSGTKGKAIGLIDKVKRIELGEHASAMHQVMKLTLLAELYTWNGDYAISNDNYRKAYAFMPNFRFYQSMVTNMRLKGDEAQAKAVVAEYRALLEKEYPGDNQATRRQELLQFVETALSEDLTAPKANKTDSGDGK